jgi:hypothetical protein
LSTGEVLEENAGLFSNIDKTKPMSDEQYAELTKLPDEEKRRIMSGFKNTAQWPQEAIEKHYQSAHFPELRYHSSGGGGKGSPTPPRSK